MLSGDTSDAVTMMTGMSRSRGSAPILSSTSNPESRGIIRSSSTQSGRSRPTSERRPPAQTHGDVIDEGARPLGSSVTDIEALKRRIAREHGLDCGQFKASFFLRRLEARLRQTEQSSIRGYLGLLDRDGAETGRL